MIAAFQLIRKGQDPIQPRDDLTYSSNFLYMLTEKEQDPIAAKVFDRCLILHAEHSLNASTFSARVTASTLTDPYAVIASAVGTLAGPLHGGANEDVIAMLEEPFKREVDYSRIGLGGGVKTLIDPFCGGGLVPFVWTDPSAQDG